VRAPPGICTAAFISSPTASSSPHTVCCGSPRRGAACSASPAPSITFAAFEMNLLLRASNASDTAVERSYHSNGESPQRGFQLRFFQREVAHAQRRARQSRRNRVCTRLTARSRVSGWLFPFGISARRRTRLPRRSAPPGDLAPFVFRDAASVVSTHLRNCPFQSTGRARSLYRAHNPGFRNFGKPAVPQDPGRTPHSFDSVIRPPCRPETNVIPPPASPRSSANLRTRSMEPAPAAANRYRIVRGLRLPGCATRAGPPAPSSLQESAAVHVVYFRVSARTPRIASSCCHLPAHFSSSPEPSKYLSSSLRSVDPVR